jgi:antitoxin (DNA-binding transcriptional repressor) of toxin-antitoxin stability system
MKTMTISEMKAQLSEVLGKMVKDGEPIAISDGKRKIAQIIPSRQLRPQSSRQLGLMRGRASCVIHDDFAMNDETVLGA